MVAGGGEDILVGPVVALGGGGESDVVDVGARAAEVAGYDELTVVYLLFVHEGGDVAAADVDLELNVAELVEHVLLKVLRELGEVDIGKGLADTLDVVLVEANGEEEVLEVVAELVGLNAFGDGLEVGLESLLRYLDVVSCGLDRRAVDVDGLLAVLFDGDGLGQCLVRGLDALLVDEVLAHLLEPFNDLEHVEADVVELVGVAEIAEVPAESLRIEPVVVAVGYLGRAHVELGIVDGEVYRRDIPVAVYGREDDVGHAVGAAVVYERARAETVHVVIVERLKGDLDLLGELLFLVYGLQVDGIESLDRRRIGLDGLLEGLADRPLRSGEDSEQEAGDERSYDDDRGDYADYEAELALLLLGGRRVGGLLRVARRVGLLLRGVSLLLRRVSLLLRGRVDGLLGRSVNGLLRRGSRKYRPLGSCGSLRRGSRKYRLFGSGGSLRRGEDGSFRRSGSGGRREDGLLRRGSRKDGLFGNSLLNCLRELRSAVGAESASVGELRTALGAEHGLLLLFDLRTSSDSFTIKL